MEIGFEQRQRRALPPLARALDHESKAIGEIAASIEVVHAVIDDVESYPQFMPYTVECRVLKRERNSVLTYQRISAPLVSDRDYTVRVRTSSKPVEGGISYLSRWETENALGPPEKPGVVRVKLCEGGWLLEPTGSEHHARHLYDLHRQRRRHSRVHQEHRKPDRNSKDVRGGSQTSAGSEIQRSGEEVAATARRWIGASP